MNSISSSNISTRLKKNLLRMENCGVKPAAVRICTIRLQIEERF
jgi:hypothetical protein